MFYFDGFVPCSEWCESESYFVLFYFPYSDLFAYAREFAKSEACQKLFLQQGMFGSIVIMSDQTPSSLGDNTSC